MNGAYLFDPWNVVCVTEAFPGQWMIVMDSGATWGFFDSECEANLTAASGWEVRL